MFPIGVATTYSVPGRNSGSARLPSRSVWSPAPCVLLAISLMGFIVGAAGQPLQPTPSPPGPPANGVLEPARSDTPLVALVVPLSGRQQSLGMAIRDGFIAASLEAPESRRFNTLIIDEARVSAAEAHAQALNAGARVLVGPLLKESVLAMAPLVTTMPGQMAVLALNNLADTDPGNGDLWQFALAPEDEAREIAARATALGQRRAVVLIPATAWGERLLAAFSSEFALRGGVVVDARTYLPGTADFTVPIRRLLLTTDTAPAPAGGAPNPVEKPSLAPGRRQDVDLILVVANSSNGRQIVPQLKFFGASGLAAYSTSAIWEDGATDDDDLNGVIFPDSPWVIAPNSRQLIVKNGVVRHWGRALLSVSRLYGLGYDAYQLLPEILSQPSPGPFALGEISGASGVLYADAAGRIHRRLTFAEIRGGRPVSLPPPMLPPLAPPLNPPVPPGGP